MFSGARVLREQDGNILFYTDLIPVETIYVGSHTDGIVSRGNSNNISTTVVPFHAVRIQGPGSYTDQSGYVSVNEPVAVPVTDQPRSMIVTVPSNAGPGSVLTVSCPNGIIKSVSVLITCIYHSLNLYVIRWLCLHLPGLDKNFWFNTKTKN